MSKNSYNIFVMIHVHIIEKILFHVQLHFLKYVNIKYYIINNKIIIFDNKFMSNLTKK
jgi:hypothetical protein